MSMGKRLLKRLHLETSSDLLFRFIPWCVAVSDFLFKQMLHLSIARFTGAHLGTIFQANSALLFVDLRFQTPLECFVSFLYCLLLNDFYERRIIFKKWFHNYSFTTTVSNFSFKERLHLSIARFTRTHLRTIFQAISALLFVDLRFQTSFESFASFLYRSLLNGFLFQTGLINNVTGLAFSV